MPSYDSEQRRYEEDVPKSGKQKKKLTREDFKQDIADAVKKGVGRKAPKKKRAPRTKSGAGGYDSMKVAELRSFLNAKKKSLLTKSGFPNGALPRSKAAMIQLCKALKRKRW
jgi:hypothetical protein